MTQMDDHKPDSENATNSSNRELSPIEQSGDKQDTSLRPLQLDDFVGQKQLRANLSVYLEASRKRNDAMDHVLFYGPPGLGKTTLAQITARELGVGFRATSGPMLTKAGDLAAILTNLQPRDVLFIDEIHRMNANVEEVLYPAMEDFQLDLVIGEGPTARSVRIDLPPFTLVAATTRAGLVSRPLRDRFGIPLQMEFYTEDELMHVVTRGAEKMDLVMTDDGAVEIARRSRGTPRVAMRLLRRIRDVASVGNTNTVDAKLADTALQMLDIDAQGLDTLDRRYLTTMATNYAGGPVGVETMAAALASERDVLEEVIEPFLIQQGLIQRTPRGRMLSPIGWEYIGMPAPKNAQDTLL